MKKRTKHIKLFEEIGFDYSNKPTIAGEESAMDKLVSSKPFSIDSLEGTFKKIAKISFEAGRNSKVTFEDFWAETWSFGQPKEPKKTLAKSPIGFKSAPPTDKPLENRYDVENAPRRMPKRIPKRPGPNRQNPNQPGGPGHPEEDPTRRIGKPGKRKGIWFGDE